jgi:hypothetical protein
MQPKSFTSAKSTFNIPCTWAPLRTLSGARLLRCWRRSGPSHSVQASTAPTQSGLASKAGPYASPSDVSASSCPAKELKSRLRLLLPANPRVYIQNTCLSPPCVPFSPSELTINRSVCNGCKCACLPACPERFQARLPRSSSVQTTRHLLALTLRRVHTVSKQARRCRPTTTRRLRRPSARWAVRRTAAARSTARRQSRGIVSQDEFH